MVASVVDGPGYTLCLESGQPVKNGEVVKERDLKSAEVPAKDPTNPLKNKP